MNNLEIMRKILKRVGMPEKQQSDLCCYVMLAMSGIKPNDFWINATNDWIRIHDIIAFTAEEYNKQYAENSRETFRKQAIHHFRNAALIEDNGKATNSPDYKYRITNEFIRVIKSRGDKDSLRDFLDNHDKLVDIYASKKEITKIPVRINTKDYLLSSGKHNELQKLIISEFASRFAPNSTCLYVGDTIEKDLVKNEAILQDLGFVITLHDKMPDVVLYSEEKKWLYFIEAVTSVGPMDPKRILEINEMTKNVNIGKIFITAFLDFKTYKKFSDSLAWDTEVWIAEMPNHMIHLNGDKFIGPR